MLLHQKNAVTTSKPVIAIACYHIKIDNLMPCFDLNFSCSALAKSLNNFILAYSSDFQ